MFPALTACPANDEIAKWGEIQQALEWVENHGDVEDIDTLNEVFEFVFAAFINPCLHQLHIMHLNLNGPSISVKFIFKMFAQKV